MNQSAKALYIAECKVQASILLKSLHSTLPGIMEKTRQRFQVLPEFKDPHSNIKAIQRKYALNVVAIENSFRNWADLKIQIETRGIAPYIDFIVGGHMNKWFASYMQAKQEQLEYGGYLLPYKNQYFICDEDYIQQLGLNPSDEDWQKIGKDWLAPKDIRAWVRLCKKIIKIQLSKKR